MILITLLENILDHVNYITMILKSISLTLWMIFQICRMRDRFRLTMPSLNYICLEKTLLKQMKLHFCRGMKLHIATTNAKTSNGHSIFRIKNDKIQKFIDSITILCRQSIIKYPIFIHFKYFYLFVHYII